MELSEQIKAYATGNQDIEAYKRRLGNPSTSDNSYFKIDWQPKRKFIIRMIRRMKRKMSIAGGNPSKLIKAAE